MSKAYLNIPSTIDDPNYRYKMQRLIAKVEGRGNGIKTNVVNCGEIAQALKRPPTYLAKFLGIELGANNKYETKEKNAIINGAFEQATMQKKVDLFIEMYVLCPKCKLPEIDLLVVEGTVSCCCNACGSSATMNNQHKLATFIIKNPPALTTVVTAGKITEQAAKKEKKPKKDREEGDEESTPKEKKSKPKKSKSKTTVDGDDGDGPPTTSSKASRMKEGKKSGTKELDEAGEGDESVEKKKKKDKKEKDKKEKDKKKKKSKAVVDAMTENVTSYDFNSPQLWPDVIDRLRLSIGSNLDANPSDTGATARSLPAGLDGSQESLNTFWTELRRIQLSQVFTSDVRMFVALNVLLADSNFDNDMVKQVIPYIERIKDASLPDLEFLCAVEHFFYRRKREGTMADDMLFPYFLNTMYQAELVDEDSILKFYDDDKSTPAESHSASHEEAKKDAAPFLQHLKDAGSDDDSDDEDDSGDNNNGEEGKTPKDNDDDDDDSSSDEDASD
eukprot:Selendium_serpulae@DN4054_c0_g1_i1.p1